LIVSIVSPPFSFSCEPGGYQSQRISFFGIDYEKNVAYPADCLPSLLVVNVSFAVIYAFQAIFVLEYILGGVKADAVKPFVQIVLLIVPVYSVQTHVQNVRQNAIYVNAAFRCGIRLSARAVRSLDAAWLARRVRWRFAL
jgi:hypothetical protein